MSPTPETLELPLSAESAIISLLVILSILAGVGTGMITYNEVTSPPGGAWSDMSPFIHSYVNLIGPLIDKIQGLSR